MAQNNRNYHPPTLSQIPSKRNMFYVVITKPEELRDGKATIQVRRSTGTTDQRIARTRMPKIAEQIYAEWDKLLDRDLFIDELDRHWVVDAKVGDLNVKDFVDRYGRVQAAEIVCLNSMEKIGDHSPIADELFKHMSWFEARELRAVISLPENPYPLAQQNQQQEELRSFIEELDGETTKPAAKAPIEVVNKSGCPTLLEYLPLYLKDRKWNTKRDASKIAATRNIKKFIGVVGDLPLDQILPSHAISLANGFDEKGKSYNTIKVVISNVSTMLSHATKHLFNDRVSPPQPFVPFNTLNGLSLKGYGASKRSYEALTTHQLHKLFSQDIKNDEKLLFSILITTGMRFDEAALLTWEQLKLDKNGIRYFDLSEGAIVKNNKFAARTVAIPDVLKLPNKGKGRLFNFPTNSDGKTSTAASQKLNEKYFHPIRTDSNDDRKVIHSLRHNVSGFLINLTDPAPSSEHMDWITGHGMQSSMTESERQKTYAQDPDVKVKYDIINRIEHPWLK